MKHTIGMGDEESAIEKTHNLQATEKEVKSTGFVVKKRTKKILFSTVHHQNNHFFICSKCLKTRGAT